MGNDQETFAANLCMACMAEKGEQGKCPSCGYDEHASQQLPLYLKPRTVLNNRYLVGNHLSQGGFGITYLGFDMTLKQKVVIKEYFPRALDVARDTTGLKVISANPVFREGVSSFIEEARAVAIFRRNPHIVNVDGYFEAYDTGYIVMEFLDGATLADFLKARGGKLPLDEAIRLMLTVLQALKEVHAHNLYHRDISPQNIIITREKLPVLIDFGAARYVVDEKSRSFSQNVIFKPGYSPFEQYTTSRVKIGAWSDIYACGATLYEMLTGQVPPSALDRIDKDSLQEPSKLLEHLSASTKRRLNNALLKALAVRKGDRFQQVEQFERALHKVLQPSRKNVLLALKAQINKWLASVKGLGGPATASLKKHWTIALGAVVLLLASLLVGWLVFSSPPEQFQVGNLVRLKQGVRPYAGWPEGVNRNEEATVVETDGDTVLIKFESGILWFMHPKDIETIN